jgi:hypothetical protein
MRVLYVGSSPNDADDLRLGSEVNELQRRATFNSDEPASFIFLPDMKVEDLPRELSRIRPDVLHISAHGDDESLSLADEKGVRVELTAEILASFFPASGPPRLLYLNACNSHSIAKRMVAAGAIRFGVGSSAPITNQAARASAVAFYERLLGGSTLADAYRPCAGMLQALSRSAASMILVSHPSVDAQAEVLHPVPSIVADFVDGPSPSKDGEYAFRLGILDCPPSTSQVVFFTDDESFVQSDDTFESDLTWVIRTTPVNGILWGLDDVSWWAEGDHRLFAACVKAGSGSFVIATTLCEALEKRYLRSPVGRIPKKVEMALKSLRQNNGADLTPTVWAAKKARNPVAKKPKRRRTTTSK